MAINRPDYQLTLPLELDELEDEAVIGREEALIRSEAAREALDGKHYDWMDTYRKLRDGGWPWRVAAFIAWSSSPKVNRFPKTQDELATEYLGLTSDRAVITWRKKNPAIDETIAILQTAPLFEHRAEIFMALIANAVKPDYKTHNDRKLALELLGDYVPTAKLAALLAEHQISADDLETKTDAELAALSRELMDTMTGGKDK